MALNANSRSRGWSWLHFLVRMLGMAGLAAIAAGLIFIWLYFNPLTPGTVYSALRDVPSGAADRYQTIAFGLLVGGTLVVLLWLLVELLVILFMVAALRGMTGINALVQIGLAALLLIGVNVYSFLHYQRIDWTEDHRFTLPPEMRSQLANLKDETTVVVFLKREEAKDSGQASTAARQKIVEKVEDLVEQFREFGPQFNVVVLDANYRNDVKKMAKGESSFHPSQGYEELLKQLPKELRAAVERAADNSIFFYTENSTHSTRLQWLSFDDFFRLDAKKSFQERNLVLRPQGIKPFTSKVLNIDAKKPRVGILVIHELLTTEGPKEYGLAGVKKVLTDHGFDVRDVILKKWSEFAPPEPAVYTYDESRSERLEEDLAELDSTIKEVEGALKDNAESLKIWKTSTLDELAKKLAKQLGGRQLTEQMRSRQVEFLEQDRAIMDAVLKQNQEDRHDLVKEKATLNFDRTAEQRRITDIKAKLARQLDDCDLLFIPRMTLINITLGERIPNRVYRLDQAQVDAIRDYLKDRHKPILACFGPINEPAERFDPTNPPGPDELERMFGQIGIKFGNQTVLFNAESKSLAERRVVMFAGANVEVPPVSFTWNPQSLVLPGKLAGDQALSRKPNPISEAMEAMGGNLDLRIRHPRPVYFEPTGDKKALPYSPYFMITSPASWNEDQPFPTRERTPRLEKPKPDDPTIGTLDEKRRGPFPIAVAVETALPGSWYEGGGTPGTVRIAAIGHGGLFVGSDLSPAQEKLLLNTCNWLLGRDELLPRNDLPVWSFPRARMVDDAWLGGQVQPDSEGRRSNGATWPRAIPPRSVAQLIGESISSPARAPGSPPLGSLAEQAAIVQLTRSEELNLDELAAQTHPVLQTIAAGADAPAGPPLGSVTRIIVAAKVADSDAYVLPKYAERKYQLWRWGAFLGLPVACAFLGLVVFFVRRLR